MAYGGQGLPERRRRVRAHGAEAAYANVQLVIDLTTRLGLAAHVTEDVPCELGRAATSLAQYLHDARRAWVRD